MSILSAKPEMTSFMVPPVQIRWLGAKVMICCRGARVTTISGITPETTSLMAAPAMT
jgi:hypothetical protein